IIGLLILFMISRMLPVKGVKNLSPNEIKPKLKDRKVQFIDVRTPGENKSDHVKQFKNLPLQSLKNQINTLDKNKEVVVICRSGSRSMNACRLLKKEGFNHLTNVRCGMNVWRGYIRDFLFLFSMLNHIVIGYFIIVDLIKYFFFCMIILTKLNKVKEKFNYMRRLNNALAKRS